MLFFLLRATGESADSAKAAAAARQVMEMGAASAAGGAAAGAAVTGGSSAAAGTAAGGSAAAGGLSAKLIAGVLAGLLLLDGVGVAVVIAARNAKEPETAVSEVMPDETEDVPGLTGNAPEETETTPEPTEEVPEETQTPNPEDEPVPADRLALLGGIAYYGDPAQCHMTVGQARAYAELIETRAAPYAALIDVGEGNPVLALACGSDHGEHISGDPDYQTSLHDFTGKLEVWQYADGQAEMVAATHEVYWKAGEGFVCHTYTGGTNDENGNIFPADAQSHYLDFSENAYRVEGGLLSASPIASALVEIDLSGAVLGFNSGGIIDGQSVGEAVWPAWKQQWDEGGIKSIVIYQEWPNWSQYWSADGWTSIGLGYDASRGGHVDEGLLDVQEVSSGLDTAAVLRQCAGD